MLKLIDKTKITEAVEEVENQEIETEKVDIEPVDDSVPTDVAKNSLSEFLNSITQSVWDVISQVKSAIGTLEVAYTGETKDDLRAILESIIDETTITIGVLNKASSLVDTESQQLMRAGEEKAEQIIAQTSAEE